MTTPALEYAMERLSNPVEIPGADVKKDRCVLLEGLPMSQVSYVL